MKNLYNKLQEVLQEKVLPVATRFGSNTMIQAVSAGLMYTLPLTLAASFFSILTSFPIPAVAKWFETVGLTAQFKALMGGTLNIIALLIAVSVPYSYTKLVKKSRENPLMAAFLALASYVIVMPQVVGENGDIAALSYDYLGSAGMFVAIMMGLLVAYLYVALSRNKKFLLKMPEGVPPMVTESFEPLLISFIILMIALVIRFGMSLTPMGSVFQLVNHFIGQPLMQLGKSPFSMIAIAVIANSLFFVGIHPNVINTAIVPLLYTMALGNIDAFSKNLDMPFQLSMITNSFTNNDAVGSTLSLLLAILIFGKSKRYRSLAKLSIVPNLFNINEPVIFGLPIMLNPLLFIPFMLSTVITGFIGYFGVISGFIQHYNPIIGLGLPWTTPRFISSFLTMGWQGLVLRLICMVVMIVVYLPFIKILDHLEYQKEQRME